MKIRNLTQWLILGIITGIGWAGNPGSEQDLRRPEGPMKTWTPAEFQRYIRDFDHSRSQNKILAHADRKYGLHEGNKIRTLFYNYGSIGRPNTEPSLEWPAFSSHGYAYEFGVMVGAEVVDKDGDTVHIFSDGMLDGGDFDPGGSANVWGWEPLPGYAAEGQELIAVTNKPESWGANFPADDEGRKIWPGLFGDDVITADLESYYIMDDRFNKEFQYYPFVNDSSRRGLGVEVVVRGYQYAAAVAEDIIFFQYKITNVSDKRLEKVVVGMIGDPHIGGGGDFSDDYAGFIDDSGYDSFTGQLQNVSGMVYCWDKEGSGNDFAIPWSELGWLGYKFLESPSFSNDGIDNDQDGMVDESQDDGLDNDGDWQADDATAALDRAEAVHYYDPLMWNGIDDDGDGRIDDWGDLDGKSDDLNGNGVPDPGEPDFEMLDVDEADMIGLTSFWAPIYETEEANEDDIMWLRMTPGTFATSDQIAQESDNIFIFGSGYFTLDPGESQKFSIAVIMGQGKDDLLDNAKVADWIYKLGFQFTKPPDKPVVVAVPGDGRVTLYWNDIAERSVDPVAGSDFEGYKIYRSLVKGEWGTVITNNKGIGVGYKPLAQFDYVDDIEGPHAIPSAEGYHMDMGRETGLTRVYIDSNLVNGLTYYYAVTSYDKGSVEGNLPPLECSKSLGDENVVTALPNAPAAGFEPATIVKDHLEGYGSATLNVRLIDPLAADTAVSYEISISKPGGQKLVNVLETVDSVSTIIWEDISLGTVSSVWNNRLVFGPYEAFILDLSAARLDSAVWTGASDYFGFSIALSSWQGSVLYPRDMRVEFYDDHADTSVFVNPQPIRFKVLNSDDNVQLDVIFSDRDGDTELSIGDIITPLALRNNTPTATWDITIDSSLAFTPPPEGSGIHIYVTKPFATEGSTDRYRLSFNPATAPVKVGKSALERIAVVPNPYVASSGFETPPPQVFTYGRGERRVDFIHLPQVCTIRIYTLVGEHVQTLEHNGTLFDGTESWNLLSKDGHDIAPGIYIYHVETPGGEEMIGRLAVIK